MAAESVEAEVAEEMVEAELGVVALAGGLQALSMERRSLEGRPEAGGAAGGGA